MDSIPPPAIRQLLLPPPPPRWCSEGSLIGDPHSLTRVRSRPYYFRRCKNVISRNIESLPDELLIEILVRLSADDIYDKVRVVCRRWYHLIHSDAFVCAHFHNTSYGLLLSRFGDAPVYLAATAKQGRIEISKLSFKIRFPHIASCNGLIVGIGLCKKYYPYIVNPATKCAYNLPRFSQGGRLGFMGISYVEASMEYKVVGTYYPARYEPGWSPQCAIFTVGVDKNWRHLAADQLSPKGCDVLLGVPFTTQGFTHWVMGRTHMVTLNVETETFKENHLPNFIQDYKHGYCYQSTGRYLSFVNFRKDYLMELWEMKPETGEWRKLARNIDLEAHKCRIKHEFASEAYFRLIPVGWVKYPEVYAFFPSGINRSCIIYNLDADEIYFIELPTIINSYSAVVHRNTLMWLS